jgi:hypothetical protein
VNGIPLAGWKVEQSLEDILGESKRKQARSFSEDQIKGWEATDCIDFAVALARRTGWLLHVDWITDRPPSESGEIDYSRHIPVRAYVADDADTVFDARGIKPIRLFNETVIRPYAAGRVPSGYQAAGITTRYYSEERLGALPLRFQPDERRVELCTAAIEAKPAFLEALDQCLGSPPCSRATIHLVSVLFSLRLSRT